MGRAQDQVQRAIARAFRKQSKVANVPGVQSPQQKQAGGIVGRLWLVLAEPITLCVLGALAGVVGVVFFTPVLLLCGGLLYALPPIAPAIYGSDTDLDRAAKSGPGGTLIVSDGANYFTDSLNAGESSTAVEPHGKLRLSDVSLYFDLPGHWVSVTHEISQGSDGKIIHSYY